MTQASAFDNRLLFTTKYNTINIKMKSFSLKMMFKCLHFVFLLGKLGKYFVSCLEMLKIACVCRHFRKKIFVFLGF